MSKLSHMVGGQWTTFSHPPIFDLETTATGTARIVAGIPGGDSLVVQSLAEGLTPPFFALYILHTPRGEGLPGRYQSPEMTLDELRDFLASYSAFLGSDARFDLWIYSIPEQATLVWDRHNLLYAYGPLDRFGTCLTRLGFAGQQPAIPAPHAHHYREEFDAEAARLLRAMPWHMTPLRPEDEQTM